MNGSVPVPRPMRPRGEGGQALVETAIAIPVLALLLFGIIAMVLLLFARIGAEAAAREAAREVATSARPYDFGPGQTAAQDVLRGYGLAPERAAVQIWGDPARGGTIHARVGYRVDLSWLPLPALPQELTVYGSHAERVEQYRSRE